MENGIELPASANTKEIFIAIKGQRITGAIEMGHSIYLLFEGGQAIGFTSLGGECSPAYWIESKSDLRKIIENRKSEIESRIKELGDITFVAELTK